SPRPSSTAAAAEAEGKENAAFDPAASGTTAPKSYGVGPRSGAKKNPPKIAGIPPLSALAPITENSSAPRTRPGGGQSNRGIKAAAPAPRRTGAEGIPTTTRLEPAGIPDPKPQKHQRKQKQQPSKPARSLPRRGPLFRDSPGSGSSGGGGGGGGGGAGKGDQGRDSSGGSRKRKSVVTRVSGAQAEQSKRRQRTAPGQSGKKNPKAKERKRKAKPIESRAEANAPLRQSFPQGRSDFDFDLDDDTATDDDGGGGSRNARTPLEAAAAATAGKKKARGGGA
ncbi:unnamed protein product, partial [Hapterophycus canaliculatus]